MLPSTVVAAIINKIINSPIIFSIKKRFVIVIVPVFVTILKFKNKNKYFKNNNFLHFRKKC
jgi:hypothetical protein